MTRGSTSTELSDERDARYPARLIGRNDYTVRNAVTGFGSPPALEPRAGRGRRPGGTRHGRWHSAPGASARSREPVHRQAVPAARRPAEAVVHRTGARDLAGRERRDGDVERRSASARPGLVAHGNRDRWAARRHDGQLVSHLQGPADPPRRRAPSSSIACRAKARSSSPPRERRGRRSTSRTASRSRATPAPTPARSGGWSISIHRAAIPTSSPSPATSCTATGRMSSIAKNISPSTTPTRPAPRLGGPLHPVAPVVCGVRQPRRRRRRRRARSRRPGVLPLLGVSAQRPVRDDGPPNTQVIKGESGARPRPTRRCCVRAFPRMSNYSFDYGNSHWTFLDANVYVDWTDRVPAQLAGARPGRGRDATWKFVVFHQPGFNSSRAHSRAAHAPHQRHPRTPRRRHGLRRATSTTTSARNPLKFLARPGPDGKFKVAQFVRRRRRLRARRHAFDGVTDTTPEGVHLHRHRRRRRRRVRPRSDGQRAHVAAVHGKLMSDVYSFTVVDIEGRR